MMNALLTYAAARYGSIGTAIIRDQFVEEFSYMSSCNMGLILLDKHSKRAGLSPGLLPPYINEGALVK